MRRLLQPLERALEHRRILRIAVVLDRVLCVLQRRFDYLVRLAVLHGHGGQSVVQLADVGLVGQGGSQRQQYFGGPLLVSFRGEQIAIGGALGRAMRVETA